MKVSSLRVRLHSKCLQVICLVFKPNHEVCGTVMPKETPSSVGRLSGETLLGMQKAQKGGIPKNLVIPGFRYSLAAAPESIPAALHPNPRAPVSFNPNRRDSPSSQPYIFLI